MERILIHAAASLHMTPTLNSNVIPHLKLHHQLLITLIPHSKKAKKAKENMGHNITTEDIPPPSERFSQKLSSYNFRSVSEDARYFFDLLRDDNGAHWLKIKKKTLSTGRAYSIHIAWRGLKAFYDAVSEFLNSSNLAGSFNRRIERKVFEFRRSPNTLKLVDNSVWIIVPDADCTGFLNGLIQMLEVQDEGWSGHWTQAIPQADVRLATWFEDIQAEFRGLELHGNHFG